MLVVLLSSAVAPAQSLLVAELQTVATSYHHDPARLDTIHYGLEQTINTEARRDLQAVLDEKAPIIRRIGSCGIGGKRVSFSTRHRGNRRR
jgi:hypothetical protein